ncbi:hypothetical protein LOD99_8738 [Oopsacas minuta]|uniref:Basic leucine zipper domain-containing protein n=1 Tax=Oopsacas minuta TaxID=111878 RepID=A0AAV7JGL3_9METZ|nr:hypothetical protein LOD99_8738 [Oopsacas minuta]
MATDQFHYLFAEIDIKQLNNFIKVNDISPEEAKEMKYSRRLKKMSQYNKAQRNKQKQYELALEEEKQELQLEYQHLLLELDRLQETKMYLELMGMLDQFHEESY